ncbi:hypothetical protein G6737_01050 [Polynucleobacter paneuropaeus]|jgi:hypothetical protein|nr:hypothetical protein [Polynucleobacter paneuropaeus]MBT8521128.1 hypothetical protein [Polynucleobacter paneuropaeus]MBT8538582.1 hypothetical protein [Polynucleobacter paneuropaeus]
MGKIKYLLMASLSLALLGCGTTEVIRNAATNSYQVSAQYGALNGSWGRASKEAGEKAIAYCQSMGKQFFFLNEQRTGVVGWSPQESVINFDCRDAPPSVTNINGG